MSASISRAPRPISDVCLVLEGTYPYVSGGVSSWVHDLLGALGSRTFSLLHIGPEPVRVKRMLERPFGSVRWKDDTPDNAATDVIPIASQSSSSA